MNHQLQVSNEEEDKSSSSQEEEERNDECFQENVQQILQSEYQNNQHLQQWPNSFTPSSATLVPNHQNNTQCPSPKEETKKVSLERKLKRAKQDVMEVHRSRIVRATGRKDRHSKVSTATGPKDRRVRLSPNTAIQFYDVQDRLGYDRPSKAMDWLIKEAQRAINALEKSPFQVFSREIDSTNKALNGQNAENKEGQYALEQSWSADKKTELEELARHSSKVNATMQYSADQYPEGSYKEQSSKVCQANVSHVENLNLFSSVNGSKIQSFCELLTYPQGHFHSETKKQPANDGKIQSFCELQTYPQGQLHSETKSQSSKDAKVQSFCELLTYPQGHFHSETKKQPTNDAKIQSFCELQTYPQGHFLSETKKQSAKIQSFCELQTYPQSHFHSETKNQPVQLANFFNFQSSHQNESISFSSDHHHQDFLTKTNLELREDPAFSFSPQNFPTVLGQNQMFNYQREPLQSCSNFPQTISYSNNIGFANSGLLGLCTVPTIQEPEEEQQGKLSRTLSAINATTLLHYQD